MSEINIDEAILHKIKLLVTHYTGLDIKTRDHKKLEKAISLRMKACNIRDSEFYYHKVVFPGPESYQEVLRLTNHIVNTETYFFRDKEQFEALKLQILPELIFKRRFEKKLKIWSAGCSTGEEPYSIAMILYSILPNLNYWKLSIIGTDIHQPSLEQARLGLYGPSSFRAMSSADREMFFSKKGEKWLLNNNILNMVQFESGNLFKADFTQYPLELQQDVDLIICRNVFIYLEHDAIIQIVNRFSQSLAKEGYLLTGHGEVSIHQASFHQLKSKLLPGTEIYQRLD